jgi:hypothetical protein
MVTVVLWQVGAHAGRMLHDCHRRHRHPGGIFAFFISRQSKCPQSFSIGVFSRRYGCRFLFGSCPTLFLHCEQLFGVPPRRFSFFSLGRCWVFDGVLYLSPQFCGHVFAIGIIPHANDRPLHPMRIRRNIAPNVLNITQTTFSTASKSAEIAGPSAKRTGKKARPIRELFIGASELQCKGCSAILE